MRIGGPKGPQAPVTRPAAEAKPAAQAAVRKEPAKVDSFTKAQTALPRRGWGDGVQLRTKIRQARARGGRPLGLSRRYQMAQLRRTLLQKRPKIGGEKPVVSIKYGGPIGPGIEPAKPNRPEILPLYGVVRPGPDIKPPRPDIVPLYGIMPPDGRWTPPKPPDIVPLYGVITPEPGVKPEPPVIMPLYGVFINPDQ